MQKNHWMLFEKLFALDYYEVIADEAFGVKLRVNTAIVLLLLMEFFLCSQSDYNPTK